MLANNGTFFLTYFGGSSPSSSYRFFQSKYFDMGYYLSSSNGGYRISSAPFLALVNLRTGQVIREYSGMDQVRDCGEEVLSLVKDIAQGMYEYVIIK